MKKDRPAGLGHAMVASREFDLARSRLEDLRRAAEARQAAVAADRPGGFPLLHWLRKVAASRAARTATDREPRP